MKAILLDIEGTTTPIDFVHKKLFPFAKERLGKFVAKHFDALRPEIEQLVDEGGHDKSYTVPIDPTEPGSVSAYLEHLIDQDRKSTPLKSIQGKIWQKGYEAGELRSTVFADVSRAFERWNVGGRRIAIYSSGSVLAQQLIFRFSDHGDLTQFISHFFDTRVGHKRETTSYLTIADEISIEPAEILFISDILAELDAARQAGMRTALAIREGNEPLDGDPQHRTVTSFDDVE